MLSVTERYISGRDSNMSDIMAADFVNSGGGILSWNFRHRYQRTAYWNSWQEGRIVLFFNMTRFKIPG